MRLVKVRTCVVAASLVTLAFGGCGGTEPAPRANAPLNAKRVDPSTAGNLAGRVLFEGTPPQAQAISMDQTCARLSKAGAVAESVLVNGGGLENVFVHVKAGLGDYYFEVPTAPVKLDQNGCHYEPHVFGLRVGQPLEITNSDPTPHNVHALPAVNGAFNFSQTMQGMRQTKTFTVPELMVPFKCDIHPWMSAFGGVVNHPYFAVSSDGGKFRLKGLPPGTYTVEAWHEKLGTLTQSITLKEKEEKEMTFTFKAAAGN